MLIRGSINRAKHTHWAPRCVWNDCGTPSDDFLLEEEWKLMGGWWTGFGEDITWCVITNTSRALSLFFCIWKLAPAHIGEARSLFSVRDCSSSMIVFICLCCGVRQERISLVSKSPALQGLHYASSSFSFSVLRRCSFTNNKLVCP